MYYFTPKPILLMQSSLCLNCQANLSQKNNFCANCGQKVNIHRISLHEIFHDLLHYFTHADTGIFFVLKQLIKQPGIVVKEYISGKRKKYISPVTLLLISAGILYVAFHVFNLSEINTSNLAKPETFAFKTEHQKQLYTVTYERAIKLNNFFSNYSKFVTMVAVPLIALLFWLFFIKARLNFAEHVVALMFFTALTTLTYSFVFAPISYFLGSQKAYLILSGIHMLFETSYKAWGYYQLLGYNSKKNAFKTFSYSLLVSIFWAVISAGLGFLYVGGFFG